MSQIAVLIRKKRIERGWTQEDLADESGLSQPYISSIERGRRSGLSLQAATQLAEALGLDVAELAETESGDTAEAQRNLTDLAAIVGELSAENFDRLLWFAGLLRKSQEIKIVE